MRLTGLRTNTPMRYLQNIIEQRWLTQIFGLFGLAFVIQSTYAASDQEIPKFESLKVFTAKKIITMNDHQPIATALAVADGRIVALGELESIKPWFKGREVAIDDTFKNKVIMPGFIDPHVHPSLPAITTQFPYIAPEAWDLPTGNFKAALTPNAYVGLLKKFVSEHPENTNIPFVTWGYHPLWHGELYRADLDSLFPDTPVILWHRSFHELIANTKALETLGVNEKSLEPQPGVDLDKGHFWELGARALASKMTFIFEPTRYAKGMSNFLRMLHQGGVTTAMDMGTGIFGNASLEMATLQQLIKLGNSPSRVVLTPIITDFMARGIKPEDALREVEQWRESDNERVYFGRHFKLMLDGAIFSGLAQFNFPGYIDGHEGEWLVPYKPSLSYAKAFWNEGYQIHAHTNGDKSADILIKLITDLQSQAYRSDHRTTLEHFAYTTPQQLRKLGKLGAVISANPYYQYILADVYAEKLLGENRARNMVPLGGAVKYGLPVALHSDCPMAPLNPLTLVSSAVNRISINGEVNNQAHRLTVDEALKAITIDAAWVMGHEEEIGSLEVGKKADLVVLGADPYNVNPKKIADIEVLATVFEGEVHKNLSE